MRSLIEKSIAHYGHHNQILQFYEELNELGAAVNHYKRNKITKEELVKEIGDVFIMIEYIKVLFDIDDVDISKSIIRSKERLEFKIKNNEL